MDEREFTEIFYQYRQDCMAIAFFYLGNKEDAEDAVIEAFADLFAKPPRDKESLKPYLIKIVVAKAIRLFKKNLKKKQDDKKDIDEFGADDRKTRPLEELHAKIALLPLRQAQAINLVFLEEYSETEAASIMGCAPSAMRKRIERAKKNLRKIYGDDYG